jgi:acetyl esterase/lipase
MNAATVATYLSRSRHMRHVLLLALTLTTALSAGLPAAEEILLWPDCAPGSEGKTAPERIEKGSVVSVHKPSLTVFLPPADKATGSAVLVIPGGGHRMVCVNHEGINVAERLNQHGIAAFMLKYRLAREEGSTYTIMDHAVPDTQRAMRLIRARTAEWKIDPAKLGAMGFSAGGELVAQICMKPGMGATDAADPIDRGDARPAYQALIYPGRSADIIPEKGAPPAFLCAGWHDRQDIAEGLAEVYLRFKRAGVPAEFIMYANVGHGFGVKKNDTGAAAAWPERFVEWLVQSKLHTPRP